MTLASMPRIARVREGDIMIGRSDCAKGLPGERFFSAVHRNAVIRVAIPLPKCRMIRHNSPMTPLLSGDCEGSDRIRPRNWAFLWKDPTIGSNSR